MVFSKLSRISVLAVAVALAALALPVAADEDARPAQNEVQASVEAGTEVTLDDLAAMLAPGPLLSRADQEPLDLGELTWTYGSCSWDCRPCRTSADCPIGRCYQHCP